MKNNIYIAFIIILLSCTNTKFNNKLDAYNKKINLRYNYYSKGSDSIMFDIFYSIPFKQMIFNKNENNFNTNLSTSINVINDNKQIFSKSWNENIHVDYYEDTKSSKKLFSNSIVLPNTHNTLSLIVNDYNNHKYWYIDTLLATEEYNYLSNISLYSKNLGVLKFLENLYLEEETDTVWMKFQLIDSEFDSDMIVELSEFGSISKNISLNKQNIISKEINYLPLPISEFKKQVKISAVYKDEYREILLKMKDEDDVIKFKELIGPIEYLLSRKDYINYVELDTLNKIDFISTYLNDKYNSNLLEEFYKRVKYVNVNYFESFDRGWKSDRGRIYILNGPPLSINYEFNENGEFEIWSYSSMKFIFINKYGIFECYMCN